jgi:Tfp pilus assembly protein FimT
MTNHPQGNECSIGYSTIELAVVIAITVVFLAIAVAPKYAPRSERAQIAASDLEAGLRYAQRVALSRDRTVRFSFSVVSNSYTVQIADTNAPGGFSFLKEPATQTDWAKNISNSYAGVRISSVNIAGTNVLYFNRTNGVPCGTSGAPIATTGIIVFAAGPTVAVSPDTGYVSTIP